MVLMIDNYDSFVYNLVQYIGSLRKKVITMRNDKVSIRQVQRMKLEGIIISPGPGRPEQAGKSCALIERFSGHIPILGVCLGHQAIAHVFGGRIIKAKELLHGKISVIHHDDRTLFKGIANPFIATRYHSLVVDHRALPSCLEISAWTSDGSIMGIRHRQFNVEGVQFHPESILTEAGMKIVKNFLNGV
ncbi:anthranilate/aminodeoxychorismate synthase component II [candidate division WOR-3 bacterium RBG_13_43_14]|uniref:Anthranilate/aminodeoxychorismate synthase component II n=1 Tax=candidate division WOR-3 bacterium RBG_13_43_14 TaxID=1802590 RepID=A0A1F4U2A4_UNCW3|nr:MAG: anthranilate/aminodeoxychorismate synthase component II [candidate division WOR-3 bacterium RBG_13_43_14]